MNKILWEFEIQTDLRIQGKKLNQVFVDKKKRTCQFEDFAFLADHKIKVKKQQKIWWIPGPQEKTKKKRQPEVDSNTNDSWSP